MPTVEPGLKPDMDSLREELLSVWFNPDRPSDKLGIEIDEDGGKTNEESCGSGS